MTQYELNFSLLVEQMLSKIVDPAYRQIIVEVSSRVRGAAILFCRPIMIMERGEACCYFVQSNLSSWGGRGETSCDPPPLTLRNTESRPKNWSVLAIGQPSTNSPLCNATQSRDETHLCEGAVFRPNPHRTREPMRNATRANGTC